MCIRDSTYTDPEQFLKAGGKSKMADFEWDPDREFFGMVLNEKTGGILLDSARAVGFTVLELSKLVMLDFHYGYYKEFYGDRAKLCFMDTDSLLYEIRTENLIKDMIEAPINFDMVDVLTPEILQNLGLSLIHISEPTRPY